MFSSLDAKEVGILIDTMVECHFKEGETVIKQGDDGEVLYVVDSGELDCFKTFNEGEEETFLKTYSSGDAFGELALLYNAPRAATIKAKTDVTCFSLDRETFNNIVKDASRKKREQYNDFLSKIEILSSIDNYEREQIADALKREEIR